MTPEERLKASFPLFLAYTWTRVLRLPKPTRIQNDIADYLATGPRRRFIAAFRGVGKTFLTAAYIVWRLWREPDLKVMVVSANERFAHKISSFIKVLIGSEDVISQESVPWAELQPRAGQKSSSLEFDVGPAGPSKDPSVAAYGVTGQMTGGRADIILFDDVEVPKNSETEALREKLIDRMGEAEAILKPGGELIVLGTFQSMSSIYRGLKDKGFGMRLWPARYPLPDKMHLYAGSLAPLLKEDLERDPSLAHSDATDLGGQPTDPARFSEIDLLEREAGWGRAAFSLQFMLDTSLSDAERYPLKTRDLIVTNTARDVAPVRVAWGSSPDLQIKDLDNIGFDGDRLFRPFYRSEEFVPYTGSLLEIDPSGQGRDETAYCVTKFLNGTIYVRRWGAFPDHSEETMEALAQIAKEEAVTLIRVEGNFGDGMFSRLLMPHLRRVEHNVPVEDHKVSGQKEVRIIRNLRPVLQQHRLVIDEEVVREDLRARANGLGLERSGLYQLTHISEARGSLKMDDRIDCLSNGVAYWAAYMSADAAEAEERRAEKARQEFERLLFGTAIFGHTRRPNAKRGRGRRR